MMTLLSWACGSGLSARLMNRRLIWACISTPLVGWGIYMFRTNTIYCISRNAWNFFFFLRLCIYNCIHFICPGFLPQVSHGFEVTRHPVRQHSSAVMLPPGQGEGAGNTGDRSWGQLWALVPNMESVSPGTYSNKDHQRSREMSKKCLTA